MNFLFIATIVLNNAIATSWPFEANEKSVNHIFLNTVVKGIPLNGTQILLLTGIAEQCPYEGGTAVFRARAILDGTVETEFDDDIACSQEGGQQLIMPPSTGQEVSSAIQLFPNPAQYSVTVKMQEAIEGNAELFIYNLYGQAVKNHPLQNGIAEHSFSTEDLPQGIYLVRIKKGKETIYTSKLVIAR